MNQSELEGYACEQVTVGFGLHLIGGESGESNFNQSKSEIEQNQCKTLIPFDTQLKPL